jgi:hypothetical protein
MALEGSPRNLFDVTHFGYRDLSDNRIVRFASRIIVQKLGTDVPYRS